MIKFDAPDSMEIEIAKVFNKPGRYFLNRPLIVLLEVSSDGSYEWISDGN